MPRSAEKKVESRGGASDYRTIKRGGEAFTCAITKKSGPKSGATVCWKRNRS